MPLFDYQCSKCQHIFSKLRSAPERDESLACPECQSDGAKRMVSVFAVSSGSSSASETASPPSCSPAGGFS